MNLRASRMSVRNPAQSHSESDIFHRSTGNVYQTEKDANNAIIEIFVFAVYLCVCTILALYSQDVYQFHSNNAFTRLFVRHQFQNQFVWHMDKITNIETWYKYVRYEIYGRIFQHFNFQRSNISKKDDPLELHSKPRIWDFNIVLHPIRLRQVRVKPKKCKKHPFLNLYTDDCYPEYHSGSHERQPKFQQTKYVDTSKSDMGVVWGTIENYNLGDYIEFIPFENPNITLNNLQAMKWIDRATRLVLLTLETYNYNLEIFTISSVITEFLPTGNVVCAFTTDSIPLQTIWDIRNPGILLTACIYYFIAAYYTGNEIHEVMRFGAKNYFKVVWNYFDCGIIVMTYISLIFSILHIFNVRRFLQDIETGNELACLDMVSYHHQIYIGAVAFCTLQMWVRTFRFISFNETMLHFNMTLKRCSPEIMGFALILVIFFIIFAIVGLLAFGNKHPDFLNFQYAFFFMFRLMMRDFDYDYFESVDPVFGPIYFMSYVVVVVFVLVNMFLAIINLNYMEVKQMHGQESVIKTVLISFKNKIMRFIYAIRRKITTKGRLTSASDVSLKSSMPGVEQDMPRQLNKDEALREFFGDATTAASKSDITSDSSYKSIPLETTEYYDEDKLKATLDEISNLKNRLQNIAAAFQNITTELDNLWPRIEKQKYTAPVEY